MSEQDFDSFEITLGDAMRGERATLGKSLMDVQRELKIRASYISAIEDTDPSAFDTPGFVAGYVRSYARYLGLDPEWAYERFCAESAFSAVHGMSEEAKGPKRAATGALVANPRLQSTEKLGRTPFAAQATGVAMSLDVRGLASSLVLVAMLFGLGYGGWAVLQEVQRVQVAPVEQAPRVLAQIDPLAGVSVLSMDQPVQTTASEEALTRLYRPEALDLPVITARDSAIGTLTVSAINPRRPDEIAPEVFASADMDVTAQSDADRLFGPILPQVMQSDVPEVGLIPTQDVWVSITALDGTKVHEKLLARGEEYILPKVDEPLVLRAGNPTALYFRVDKDFFGPASTESSLVKNVPLAPEELQAAFAPAYPDELPALASVVKDLFDPASTPNASQ